MRTFWLRDILWGYPELILMFFRVLIFCGDIAVLQILKSLTFGVSDYIVFSGVFD